MASVNYDGNSDNPVSGIVGLTTAHAAGIIVIGSVFVLILIRHGFRGVSVGGVSVGLK